MGVDLTTGQMVALLNALRWSLITLTTIGCVLSALGIRIAWMDLQWATTGNGAKKIASAMRLRVEVLLLAVFAITLLLSFRYTVPIDQLVASTVLLGPIAKARFIFNLDIFLLLMVKVVMHFGRRQLDRYYDEMAAADVLKAKGLFAHRRGTDADGDES